MDDIITYVVGQVMPGLACICDVRTARAPVAAKIDEERETGSGGGGEVGAVIGYFTPIAFPRESSLGTRSPAIVIADC